MEPEGKTPWWSGLSPTGRTGRRAYALTGVLLAVIKFNMDRLLAALYQHSWDGINYLVPTRTFSLFTLPPEERTFYLLLAAVAIPFVVIGILLTVRRLRDASLSPLWSLLFYVPVVNLFFFAVLCILPTKGEAATGSVITPKTPIENAPASMPPPTPGMPGNPRGGPIYRFLYAIIPAHPLASAFVTVLSLALVGVVVTALGAEVLRNYGWGLFVGAPFCLGLIAAMIHGIRQERRFGECVSVAFLALLLICGGLLAFKFEGVICLVMALPVALPLTLLGAAIGFAIQRQYPRDHPEGPDTTTKITCVTLALLPLFLGVERWLAPSPELLPVTTRVVINAPPERVWPNVIAFSDLPPLRPKKPIDWLFYTGIAYPKRARILGTGVGAVRHCEFSTGPFVEPVIVWEPPRLLRFSVTAQPAPMHELSPYPDLHPPHLDNFLVSRQGQFLLTRLSDGRTLLEGTTWYQNRMWPQGYWRYWSDAIIHGIHGRVLEHVRELSEASEAQEKGATSPVRTTP